MPISDDELDAEIGRSLRERPSIDQMLNTFLADRQALDDARPVLLAQLITELEALDRRRDALENAILKLIRRPRAQIEVIEQAKAEATETPTTNGTGQ